MKTSVKIVMVLLAFFSYVSMSLGQESVKASSFEKKIAKKDTFNWPLPVKFNARLHPDLASVSLSHNKVLGTQQNDITLDTVVVDSYYENFERDIYTYSSGNLTVTLYQVQENNNTWQNATMNVCVYDTLGNKLVSIWENWKDSVWVNSAKNLYTYGFNRVLLTSVGKIWNNEKWENSDSSTYTYDMNGNLLVYYKETWNDTAWDNDVFELASYDSVGNLLNLTRNIWDDSLGWLRKQRYTYVYDTNQNLLSATIENGINFQWQYFYKEIYTYDAAKNRISYTGQQWREADSTWVNSEKYLYTYNSINRLINALGKNWDSTQWVNYVNAQYTHELYGAMETEYIQRWNDSTWADSALTQYVYDKYGDAIQGDYYTSDGKFWVINQDGPLEIAYNYNTNRLYFVGYHIEAFFSTPGAEGLECIKSPLSAFICSPNPASEQSIIRLVMKEKAHVNLSLYSMNGKKIENLYDGTLLKGSYQYPFSLGSLPAGVYFATFSTPKFVKSIKIVWMH